MADHAIATAKPIASATTHEPRAPRGRARVDHVAADDRGREHHDGFGTGQRAEREQRAERRGLPPARRHP